MRVKASYTKESRNGQESNSLIIVLNLIKIFERCIMYNLLISYRLGNNEEFSICLIAVIEKISQCQDKGGTLAPFLNDLSKDFHCLPQDLFIAKLCAKRQKKLIP